MTSTSTSTSIAATALRTAGRACVRYAIPFTALSIVALAPVWFVESRATAGAIDIVRARGELAIAWKALAVLWVFQLALVAGVAPTVRALVAGPADARRLGQLAATRAGLVGLARVIIPIGLATACVAMAGIALILPALIVLPLVALTGASHVLDVPVPAPVLDSVRVARSRLALVALLVGGLFVLDLAVTFVLKLALIRALPAKPTAEQLHAFNTFLRASVAALIVLSPLPAAALAATYELAVAPESADPT